MTCNCTKGLSSNHILLECPITAQSFRNDGYHVTVCNDVRGIMYIIDVISLIAKLLVYRTTPEKCTHLLGDSGGVVNSLDFCPASLKSLGCFYFRCVLSSQWKAVTVN